MKAQCFCTDEILKTPWATRVYLALFKFKNADALGKSQIFDFVNKFQECDQCKLNGKPCDDVANCSLFRLIKNQKHHFAGLRTFLRKFYELRRPVNWLQNLEQLMLDGQWMRAREFAFDATKYPKAVVENLAVINANQNATEEFATEDFILKRY
jgi:hypothetical protein